MKKIVAQRLSSALIIGLGLLAAHDAAAADRTRPNIILMVADDLGYGDLGCYGQERIQTPNLDELARSGLRWTNFYAGSTVCAPSRCVLMTGYHTGHCLIRGNAKDNLRPEDVTLAEVLRSGGYTCGLVGKWGLGHERSTGVPTRQGFDYFFGYLDQTHAHNYYPSFLHRDETRVALSNIVEGAGEFGSGVASQRVEYSHDLITQEAIQFIERSQRGPFFLYLAWTIPHANNEAGKQGMEVPDLGLYADRDWPAPQKAHAAMISRLDRDVGRIREKLAELNLQNNTLILFTSDNGPHREGGNDPMFQHSSGPLRGIKRDLTEGGIRVPMIMHWADTIAPKTTDGIAGFQDLMPTLAEVAHVSDQVPKDCDGISLVSTILGKENQQQHHDYLYWAFYEGRGGQALRMGDWKAIQQPRHSKLRLYHLTRDLHEDHDVAEDYPEIVEQVTSKMQAAYSPSATWRFPEP